VSCANIRSGYNALSVLICVESIGFTRMTQTRIVLAFLLVFASSTPVLHADNCTAIKDLKLPDTTFATADRVDSGNLDVPGIDKPLQELPVFCRVTGVLRPSADSEIRFEVWMPEKDWNNRFLGVGNGGFAGSI